jgi:murein DD-endopeptidase MepM/ murein hydrolase activator NlpD
VIIRHSKKLETEYAHLSGFAVKLNDTVKKGEVIGYVGSTGKSTAPHLHYEVRVNGHDVDPGEYFTLSARKGS